MIDINYRTRFMNSLTPAVKAFEDEFLVPLRAQDAFLASLRTKPSTTLSPEESIFPRVIGDSRNEFNNASRSTQPLLTPGPAEGLIMSASWLNQPIPVSEKHLNHCEKCLSIWEAAQSHHRPAENHCCFIWDLAVRFTNYDCWTSAQCRNCGWEFFPKA